MDQPTEEQVTNEEPVVAPSSSTQEEDTQQQQQQQDQEQKEEKTSSSENEKQDQEQKQQEEEETSVPAAPPTPRDTVPEKEEEKDEQQQKPKSTTSSRSGSKLESSSNANVNVNAAAAASSSLAEGEDNVIEDYDTASPVVLPPININQQQQKSKAKSERPDDGMVSSRSPSQTSSRRSDSVARATPLLDEELVGVSSSGNTNNQQQQQQQNKFISDDTINEFDHNENANVAVATSTSSQQQEPEPEVSSENQQQLVVVGENGKVIVPGTSQKHLFDDDAEYEEALKHYDADVMSSEAANRFAVGIHSAAASATRHFADSCELAVEETQRLADRRNKTADNLRQQIRVEQGRYGFAGVAEELGQMTSVLIEDHRRRIELLSDRVRLQLKSSLSQILREQEHAGEALRAEVVKTASLEFAQESLRGLIGMNEAKKDETGEENKNADSAATALKISAQEPSVGEKGRKAASDVYVSELEQKLFGIFTRHTNFALPKAQTVVSQARANFERLSDHLAKVEEENIRRLQRQVDNIRKHVGDMEDTSSILARKRISELAELEIELKSKTAEHERIKAHREQIQKEVKEREERIAERRKASYGVSAGGLLSSSQDYGSSPLDFSSARTPRGGILDGIPKTKAQKEKEQLEKERRANAVTARSQAHADKQAARLQASRTKSKQDSSDHQARLMSFGSKGGSSSARKNASSSKKQPTTDRHSSRRSQAATTLGVYSMLNQQAHDCLENDCRHKSPERHQSECPNDMSARDEERQYNRELGYTTGRSGSDDPYSSLSRYNIGSLGDEVSAQDRTRRHLEEVAVHGGGGGISGQQHRMETREVDPKEGVVTARRKEYHNNMNMNNSPPNNNTRQNPWIESQELRKITERTARHGLSFPDSTDTIVPTHKFLDDELAAIYELRHLRSPK